MGKEAVVDQGQGAVLSGEEQKTGAGDDTGLHFGLDEKEPKSEEGAPSPETDKTDESQGEEDQGSEGAAEEESQEETGAAEEESQEDDIPLAEQNKFTEKEKGLYQALKKERASRQQIEAELQYLRLQQKYAPKPAEPEEEAAPEAEPDPVDEALKDRTDEDILTVADVKKLMRAQAAKVEKIESKKSDEQAKRAVELKELAEKVSAAEDKLRPALKGYDEAVHYARVLMDAHPGLKGDFNAIVRRDGAEAAAKWAYNLGKSHREFGTGKFVSQDPKAKARADAKKAIDNSEKSKTSAGAGPGRKSPLNVSHQEMMDMEPEDLARTLASLPESEYSKIPKAIRTRALQAL